VVPRNHSRGALSQSHSDQNILPFSISRWTGDWSLDADVSPILMISFAVEHRVKNILDATSNACAAQENFPLSPSSWACVTQTSLDASTDILHIIY